MSLPLSLLLSLLLFPAKIISSPLSPYRVSLPSPPIKISSLSVPVAVSAPPPRRYIIPLDSLSLCGLRWPSLNNLSISPSANLAKLFICFADNSLPILPIIANKASIIERSRLSLYTLVDRSKYILVTVSWISWLSSLSPYIRYLPSASYLNTSLSSIFL